jgi:hypothetical protein
MQGKGCLQIGLELVEISVEIVWPCDWLLTLMSGANSRGQELQPDNSNSGQLPRRGGGRLGKRESIEPLTAPPIVEPGEGEELAGFILCASSRSGKLMHKGHLSNYWPN